MKWGEITSAHPLISNFSIFLQASVVATRVTRIIPLLGALGKPQKATPNRKRSQKKCQRNRLSKTDRQFVEKKLRRLRLVCFLSWSYKLLSSDFSSFHLAFEMLTLPLKTQRLNGRKAKWQLFFPDGQGGVCMASATQNLT